MTFEEIYKEYWQKVFRLCMGYLNDKPWAKDVCQETFITVWQQLPKFRNESSVGTWIFRIASNHCLRQIEKQNRMPPGEMPHDVADHSGTDNIEAKTQLLYKLISEMPEVDRIIISLELEDVKQAEIANIVGLSEANIRVKIHRIKDRLTEKFKEYEKNIS
jgi:RNA polymerase sigma-70 factor (ECF subfamily)